MQSLRAYLAGLIASGAMIATPCGSDPPPGSALPASAGGDSVQAAAGPGDESATSVGEPARSLTGRGLENLLAFSRLFGFVRYFHPSDEAAGADWERLAIDGVREVEGAPTPEELVATLQRLFRPIAPTVSVFTTVGDLPSLPRSQPPNDPTLARVVAWRHAGPTGNPDGAALHLADSTPEPSGAACHSERVWVGPPIDDDSLAARNLPDPRDPWVTDLTHGVTCIVPLALYADEHGTVPAATAQSQLASPARPAGFVPSGNDRATRLAVAIVAWNALQQFYPYFDEVPAHWPSVLARTLMEAAAVRDERVFLLTLTRMTAELRDGQAEARFERPPPTGWLPLRWEWAEGKLIISGLESGAPREIRRGDIVTSYDGHAIEQALFTAESIVSAATPAHRRFRALRELRRGPPGGTVRLGLLHSDGSADSVTIPRIASDEGPAVRTAEPAPGVLYCDLTRVGADSLRALLPSLAASPAVVFDLRGGSGGFAILEHLISAPVGFPCRHQLVVTRPDRQGIVFRPSTWELRPFEPHIRGRVVFLADAGTRGRAEALLGAVQHFNLAEIVGEPTAGTDGEVVRLSLPGGYEIRFTGTKALGPDGTRRHGAGIRAAVPARRTPAGIAAGRDEILDRAIEILREPAAR